MAASSTVLTREPGGPTIEEVDDADLMPVSPPPVVSSDPPIKPASIPQDHTFPLTENPGVFSAMSEALSESGNDREHAFNDLWHGFSIGGNEVVVDVSTSDDTSSLDGIGVGLMDEEPLPGDDADEDVSLGLTESALDADGPAGVGTYKHHRLPSPESPLYPYPSRALFLTATLLNSPRLCFSNAQKDAILHFCRCMGGNDVPTLSALEKCQKLIGQLIGSPTQQAIGGQTGSVFYKNNPAAALAKDHANPITRHAMIDHPVDRGGAMSQTHDADKMLMEAPSQPSVDVAGTIYFVDELLRLRNGRLFIPDRFIYMNPSPQPADADPRTWELYAIGRTAAQTELGVAVSDSQTFVSTSEFATGYEALRDELRPISFAPSSVCYGKRMPNDLCRISRGRVVQRVPVILFVDDCSANITTQWNKNHVVYMSNALLPREMLDKEFNVRFVSSSPSATPAELTRAVKSSLEEAAKEGICTYDCKYAKEVVLIPCVHLIAGDNPMLAELLSHGGLRCNKFCRTCKVGGTQKYKQSEAGYASLFTIGFAQRTGGGASVERSIKSTGIHDAGSKSLVNMLVCLGKDLLRASRPGDPVAVNPAEEQTLHTPFDIDPVVGEESGQRDEEDDLADVPLPELPPKTHADIEERLRAEVEKLILDEEINPLLGLKGFNIHKDTPTEILHTILLGVVKYFWGQTIYLLKHATDSNLLHTFRARLNSLSTYGLNLTTNLSSDYLCQYSGGLIGKHMKSLAQVMPFLVCNLVDDKLLHAWNVIGRFVVLLWHTAIKDKEAYLVCYDNCLDRTPIDPSQADLSKTIHDFLDLTAQCAPSILISKPKFHFLVHLPAYIRRFGPAILYSTERYESFNRVFRLTCIFSNRQAPSRDTCKTFADFDAFKHIITGGYWRNPDKPSTWVRAGPEVRQYFKEHPKMKCLYSIPTTVKGSASGIL
ncbi:unnamed protein product [Peniophora sp. CBMAI 1063]|nr:unnamed protein product [Peniophora sp. CBMAI 1063]